MLTRLLDSLAAYVVAGLVLGAAALFESGYGGPGADPSVLNVVGSLVIGAAVVLARWSPFGAIVLVAASVAVPSAFLALPATGGSQLIASMLLVGHAAYRLRPRQGLAAYLLAAVVPAVTITIAGQSVWEFAFYTLILGPAWVVGALLRREQERSRQLLALTEALRAERGKQAEVAVAAERTRISRDLHDAVAHTVSVMTLQVGVVRRRLEAGSVENETLRGTEQLGRQAVDELRRIVGLVQQGEPVTLTPLPSLRALDELAEQVRSAGTTVDVVVSGGVDRVPQAVDISAFRIVQEALTNALRHAPGSAVHVDVEVHPAEVVLCVRNGPASGRPVEATPGGHGLPGMLERAHVLGGELTAAPDGRGFAVRARLPFFTVDTGVLSGRS